MTKSIGIRIIGLIEILGVIFLWNWLLNLAPNLFETSWIFYLIIYSLLMLSAGIGILLLKRWARLLVILLNLTKALEVTFQLIKNSCSSKIFNISLHIRDLLVIIICIFIIWFLSRKTIKQQFN